MKQSNGDGQARNIISQGTNIHGDITSDGDFRIEGYVKGTVIAKGKVVIGESGQIEGQMQCISADISGKVNGKVEIEDIAVLRSTSVFTGDIITKKISVEPGAVFTGNCQMVTKEPRLNPAAPKPA